MDYGKKPCTKCGGKGVVKDSEGTISTCFDCLLNGNLDQHDKNIKESGLKI